MGRRGRRLAQVARYGLTGPCRLAAQFEPGEVELLMKEFD